MRKKLIFCMTLSFLFWAVPFTVVLSVGGISHNSVNKQGDYHDKSNNQMVEHIITAYSKNDRMVVFKLICLNNLKVMIVNIIGGFLLGLGTLVNLLQNGVYTAGVFSAIHKGGMAWKDILAYTAPHSFEMIGIWLSGGIGFFIAKTIFDMTKNKSPSVVAYKIMVGGIIISSLIILLAAYVEAFVSVT